MNRRRNATRRATPPYGPTSGMLQGLTLLQKANIARVDEELLREHGVAPGNEYKAIGALRFLGLLDDQGRPTERSRQLRTRGPAFNLALEEIVHDAYRDLFDAVDLRRASKDEVYNYFVTQAGLGMEMAQKATRFLVGLCQLAGLELSPMLEASARKSTPAAARSAAPPRGHRPPAASAGAPGNRRPVVDRPEPHVPLSRTHLDDEQPIIEGWDGPSGLTPGLPFILALTPQTVELSEDDLARLFRKMLSAYRRAQQEAG